MTLSLMFSYTTPRPRHIPVMMLQKGKQQTGNLLYRYELINGRLVNPKMLLDLPATPGAIGNGGKVIIGPDNNVYLTIGSVGVNGHISKAKISKMGVSPTELAEYSELIKMASQYPQVSWGTSFR